MSDTEQPTVEETKPETIVEDLSNPDVVTKYKAASEIVKLTLAGVVAQAVAGKSVAELCQFGDAVLLQQCGTVYKSKKIDKGIAFPTCVSVNNMICHYSPLPTESIELKAGDWVKVDMGAHIDGFIAVVAHTFIVPQHPNDESCVPEPITGAAANVMLAAHHAVEVCKRLIKPGNRNKDVTSVLERVCESFGVKAMQGTVMHQMKRFVIDGNKTIAQKHDPLNKTAEIEFEQNEVYAIDVCLTTGLDKPVEAETRTTVFKRDVEKNYQLKMKASRNVLSEINKKASTLPFSLNLLSDERQARMGVVECCKHGLLQSYPVLQGREGDFIVHLKGTILLLPSGQTVITGMDLPLELIKSERSLDEETAVVLAQPLPVKKPKKKKKKNKSATTTTTTTMTTDDDDNE